MKMFGSLTIAACMLAAVPVFAEDTTVSKNGDEIKVENSREPASSSDTTTVQRSETKTEGKSENEIGITNFAIRPTGGAIFFSGQERLAAGLLMDFNFVSLPWMKVGPATGALYSPLVSGNFFSGVSTSNDRYIFQIPADLKVTFAPDPARRLQLGVHGGANVIRSTGTVGSFGSTSPVATTDTGASWDVHPHVGGDLDFAISTNVDLTLRPDITFLNDFNMTTATLGLALKL